MTMPAFFHLFLSEANDREMGLRKFNCKTEASVSRLHSEVGCERAYRNPVSALLPF